MRTRESSVYNSRGTDTEKPQQAESNTTKSTGTSVPNSCNECGGKVRRDETGQEHVCIDCGLIIQNDNIDTGPEWRAYSTEERNKRSRVGSPTSNLKHDKGLTTTIDWKDKDAHGNSISSRKRAQLNRMRTWNKRIQTQDSGERNLRQALTEIKRMGSALGLKEQIMETASTIYRSCLNKDLMPGRSIEGVATASLRAATKICDNPRTIGTLAQVSRVSEEEIARTYKYIVRELELPVEPASPEDYITRYISDLEVGDQQELEHKTVELLDAYRRNGNISGKSPSGLAAAAIYAASLVIGEDITQSQLKEVTDTSKVTIRNRYKEIGEKADIEFTNKRVMTVSATNP